MVYEGRLDRRWDDKDTYSVHRSDEQADRICAGWKHHLATKVRSEIGKTLYSVSVALADGVESVSFPSASRRGR